MVSTTYMLSAKFKASWDHPKKFHTDCMIGTHAKFDFILPTDKKHVATYAKIVKTCLLKERGTNN